MSSQDRKSFANTIRPAIKGCSDKFSWRMYQRAARRGRERVYISAWDNIYGRHFLPSLDALRAGDKGQAGKIMIGEPVEDGGWFHGAPIQSVVRKGMQRVDESFAYSPEFNTRAWLEITEWFWPAYMAMGRCTFQMDWSHSWISINRNARKCAYCGKHERRSIEVIKTVERRETWQ